MRQALTKAVVRERYNKRTHIWPAGDHWHSHTVKKLVEVVQRHTAHLQLETKTILNAGSGGNDYGVKARYHVQIDLAEKHILRGYLSVGGSTEQLPFKSNFFDFILCVGSVLNYCDAVAACNELSRVLQPGGLLLLEFESSFSGEYLGRSQFGKASVMIATEYQGETELLWLFNPAYVAALLNAGGLKIVTDEGFHSATALVYRFAKSEKKAVRAAGIENLRFVARLLRPFACNRVFLAKKIT